MTAGSGRSVENDVPCDDCDMVVQHAPGCMVSPLVTVRNAPEYQGLTLWCGDRLPVHVDDFLTATDLRELIQNPILRAVAIARLRAVADLLDQPEEVPDA